MGEITLLIEDQVFKVQKSVLCEYSDYFRAMFSGNYVENDQEQITINMVDASSMKLILDYMRNGLIDLSELTLTEMGELAGSATFLQMRELLKQIEYTLNMQLSFINWMSIMDLAEMSSFPKLEIYVACFGLLQFKSMKTEYVPNIEKLFWYLSHPYLNNETELSVFQFGLQWICENQLSADALLIILGCLDIPALNDEELHKMQTLLKPYEHSLAAKMTDCLRDILTKTQTISTSSITKNKTDIIQSHTERVYMEVLRLVADSVVRELSLVPCISASRLDVGKAESGAQYLYKFDGRGMKRWVEYPERNVWGWSLTGCILEVAVAGGEYGRGSGVFQRDVMTLEPPLPACPSPAPAPAPAPAGAGASTTQWRRLGAHLPPRRHAGVVMHRDKLYIVGGVGQFRIVLSSVLEYDLTQRTHNKLPEFPDAIQNPALCVHADVLYAAGERALYRLTAAADSWERVLDTAFRANCLLSYGEHVYVTQSYYNALMRYRPGRDARLEQCACFTYPVVALCNVGRSIVALTQEARGCGAGAAAGAGAGAGEGEVEGERAAAAVERFHRGDVTTLWTDAHCDIKFNEVSGCCAVLGRVPSLAAARGPLTPAAARYATTYLQRFIHL